MQIHDKQVQRLQQKLQRQQSVIEETKQLKVSSLSLLQSHWPIVCPLDSVAAMPCIGVQATLDNKAIDSALRVARLCL